MVPAWPVLYDSPQLLAMFRVTAAPPLCLSPCRCPLCKRTANTVLCWMLCTEEGVRTTEFCLSLCHHEWAAPSCDPNAIADRCGVGIHGLLRDGIPTLSARSTPELSSYVAHIRATPAPSSTGPNRIVHGDMATPLSLDPAPGCGSAVHRAGNRFDNRCGGGGGEGAGVGERLERRLERWESVEECGLGGGRGVAIDERLEELEILERREGTLNVETV